MAPGPSPRAAESWRFTSRQTYKLGQGKSSAIGTPCTETVFSTWKPPFRFSLYLGSRLHLLMIYDVSEIKIQTCFFRGNSFPLTEVTFNVLQTWLNAKMCSFQLSG
ncbi:unnamed protein product [Caretta caretta]